MEVVVEYEYEAAHEDELTLRIGDIIKNVRYIEEEGWMEGDLNGRRGLFPDNFVKELKKEPKEVKEVKETKSETKEESSQPQRREKSAGNVANLVQRMSTIGIPTCGFLPQPPAAAKSTMLCLSLPSNFVKERDAGEEGETVDTTADETSKDTQNDVSGTELTGTPPAPQSTSGNGVIAQPKKIRGVGFGDIFQGGSVKLRARLPSPESEDKKDKPVPSLPSATKPAHPTMTDLQKAEGDSKSKAKEYCKVLFPFEASNEDELSLKEGDIIHVLSKDTGEPGWWRGELGGKEGVFPDNFVTVVPEAEKESSTSRGSLKSSPRQESEEKPKKPPPPSKSIAPKPEVPSADKKPHHIRAEDKVDKPSPDFKPLKPAAPVVPHKKPVPLPGKARPIIVPPKKPDKHPIHSADFTCCGSLFHLLAAKCCFVTLAFSAPPTGLECVDLRAPLGVFYFFYIYNIVLMFTPSCHVVSSVSLMLSPTADLMSFDELSYTSEKLSHPTANRPKMPGRRLPAQFGGTQSETYVEKSVKADEEDGAKSKLTEPRTVISKNISFNAPAANILSHSPSFQKPSLTSTENEPSPAAAAAAIASSSNSVSQGNRFRPESEDSSSDLEELRGQMKDLLMSVELLKAQQMKEISDLRRELDEERIKRVTLQMEVEKLKRSVHRT
ncbi:CD2-associated protein [Cynoglossus semilaevis]|uniref:CD2-associated protein n=1 Tax=Cynoglossus semilaevis TaxID=244447 RepID=UPI000D62E1C4|nr:CD2-associated protein [Cynoglossus semilaevis]